MDDIPVPKSSNEKLHPIPRMRSMNFFASPRLEIALVSDNFEADGPGRNIMPRKEVYHEVDKPSIAQGDAGEINGIAPNLLRDVPAFRDRFKMHDEQPIDR